MGKGIATTMRPGTSGQGEERGGLERTLDPVAEPLPAWPEAGEQEWRGFPATPAFASAVRQSIQAAAIDRMVCPEDTADLVLATSEAFANAVRHGACGPEDAVWLAQQWRPDGVTIRLRYRGAPFAAEAPGLPPSAAASGRGRYIMNRLMDQVEYRFAGGWTELTLTHRLRRSERAAAPA